MPPRRLRSLPNQKPCPARRSGLDLEEMLGTNWLNKIGIGILVLGLAFFWPINFRNGPPEKSFWCWSQRRHDCSRRTLRHQRALPNSGPRQRRRGWSLLYFVSYAVYHVPAAHVIESRELDFFLMLAVAAAIVWYSLRYRSQTTLPWHSCCHTSPLNSLHIFYSLAPASFSR